VVALIASEIPLGPRLAGDFTCGAALPEFDARAGHRRVPGAPGWEAADPVVSAPAEVDAD
jgi:hypothetical protein